MPADTQARQVAQIPMDTWSCLFKDKWLKTQRRIRATYPTMWTLLSILTNQVVRLNFKIKSILPCLSNKKKWRQTFRNLQRSLAYLQYQVQRAVNTGHLIYPKWSRSTIPLDKFAMLLYAPMRFVWRWTLSDRRKRRWLPESCQPDQIYNLVWMAIQNQSMRTVYSIERPTTTDERCKSCRIDTP